MSKKLKQKKKNNNKGEEGGPDGDDLMGENPEMLTFICIHTMEKLFTFVR